MATFPRLVKPIEVSALWTPGALKERSHSGLMQIRATKQLGWSWQEGYGLLNVRKPDDMGLMAFVNKTWSRGQIHDFTHPLMPGSGISPNGVGTGTILVKGASQVGDTVLTDGWAINTPKSVRAGDMVKFSGDNAVYQLSEDADSNGAGEVSLVLHTSLRLSPADNAPVTKDGVVFRATIIGRSQFEGSRSPNYFAGLEIIIGEALI